MEEEGELKKKKRIPYLVQGKLGKKLVKKVGSKKSLPKTENRLAFF